MGTGANKGIGNCTQELLYQRNRGSSSGISLESGGVWTQGEPDDETEEGWVASFCLARARICV